MDPDQIYAGLVDGTVTEVPPELAGNLSDRARRNTIAPDPEVRAGAVRVALALPPAYAVSVAMALVRDTDVTIRRRAVNVALKAQAEGLTVLRRLAADPDEGIAGTVLDLLVAAVDAPSAGLARELLRDPRASVRARAATLAGAAGGPGLLVDLRKIAGDPDPGVRAAVDVAIARLTGKSERPTPGRWWERDPVPDEGVPLPPPPAFVAPASTAPAASGEAHPAAAADVTSVLTRLGAAAPDDREALESELAAAPASELQKAVQSWKPGGDPHLGRGIAFAIAALDRQAWITRLQPLLDDPHPGVRSAAVEAVGRMGGLSTIPWAIARLKDPDPGVVAATCGAVGALCGRFNRAPMAKQWLTALTTDKRAGVADAARTALAAAGA